MEDDNEDDLKNKEDLHIAGRHMALDIFRFAVFLKLDNIFKYLIFREKTLDKTILSFGPILEPSSNNNFGQWLICYIVSYNFCDYCVLKYIYSLFIIKAHHSCQRV